MPRKVGSKNAGQATARAEAEAGRPVPAHPKYAYVLTDTTDGEAYGVHLTALGAARGFGYAAKLKDQDGLGRTLVETEAVRLLEQGEVVWLEVIDTLVRAQRVELRE